MVAGLFSFKCRCPALDQANCETAQTASACDGCGAASVSAGISGAIEGGKGLTCQALTYRPCGRPARRRCPLHGWAIRSGVAHWVSLCVFAPPVRRSGDHINGLMALLKATHIAAFGYGATAAATRCRAPLRGPSRRGNFLLTPIYRAWMIERAQARRR